MTRQVDRKVDAVPAHLIVQQQVDVGKICQEAWKWAHAHWVLFDDIAQHTRDQLR